MVKAVTERHDKQAAPPSFTTVTIGLGRRRVEHYVSQHHRVSRRMADKIDRGGAPHLAAAAHRLRATHKRAGKRNGTSRLRPPMTTWVCILFHRFLTKWPRRTFTPISSARSSRRASVVARGNTSMKGKRVSMTEKSSRVSSATETDQTGPRAAGEEPVGEPAKGKHLKGSVRGSRRT